MGKIKDIAKSAFNLAKKPINYSEDLIRDVTGIPPLHDVVDSYMSGSKLDMPSAPPAAPTILTDDTVSSAKADEEKRKKLGRILTQRTSSLSDATTYKPTLLGG